MSMTATYSPDDNKLRLYSSSRLDPETYSRVQAAGFKWAPKQELFVAPAWKPSREDLLLELCGEIDDEDATLVERAEERAERFEDYGGKRANEAEAARQAVARIADGIPFGQPILIGHHSERRARRDAEKIGDGMRRAVKLWETSQYWESRAAGALAHAKYKERPDVRARRIKTIESDKRRKEAIKAEALQLLATYEDPASLQVTLTGGRGLVAELLSSYSGGVSFDDSARFRKGEISLEEAMQIAIRNQRALITWSDRWIAHFDNRLTYERAMLAEQGGLITDRMELQVGGTVLVRGEWLVIKRINKTGGKVCSVSTNSRYVRVKPVEEIKEYRAPDAQQAAKAQAAAKLPTLVNYPGEGFAHVTQAEWDAIPKDYRGSRVIEATETVGRHRVRRALGVYVLKGEQDWNKRHGYPSVFITDAKHVLPPAASVAPKLDPLPAPTPASTTPRPVYQAPEPNDFDRMREQLRTGIKVVSAPQLFPTPPDLAARMVDLAGLCDGDRILEPSAGTGRLITALRATGKTMHIVAVEVNAQLGEVLRDTHPNGSLDLPQELESITADFLTLQSLGRFDVIVMNPPFENAADVKHITHALTMLEPGGRLVALCANGPRQTAVLRPLVESRGGLWEELPADTFKSEGTGVRTALLTLQG